MAAVLEADRFFDPDPAVRRVARELYDDTRTLPIVSPHGHVDAGILARNERFAEPAALIVQPDHYILRLLYARGVPLEDLGVPRRDGGGERGGGAPVETDPCRVWQRFADHYYLRPGGYLFKVPAELSDEVVAPVNCALSQVIHGLHAAGLRFGANAVMQGAGGLGIQAAAVAKDMGAATVIVIDQIPGRLELARAFGADHTLNFKEVPDRKERVKLVRQWTGGVGADIACDFVGFPAVIPEGIDMLRAGGTYLEIGTISRGAKIEFEPSLLVWGSKKIVGVIQYDPWVIPRALDFLVRTRDRWPWGRILSHKYPLEKINEAFAASEWHNKETTSITRAALVP